MRKGVLSVLLFTTLINAEDKIALLKNDQTIAHSNRQAVMGIADFGHQEQSFSSAVFYTPAGKNAKTRQIGTWRVSLDKGYLDSLLEQNYPYIIPSRYDKLLFEKDMATVITPTKDITKKMSMKPFSYTTGSKYDFNQKTLQYLNSEIAPKIQKVLAKASDVRYKQMASDEAENFLKDRAKETGVPAVILERLINSSFVFSVYMDNLNGAFYINQYRYKDAKGHIITTYSTSYDASPKFHLFVYEFKKNKFILHSEITSQALHPTSRSITTSTMPSQAIAQDVIKNFLPQAIKENIITLALRLKKDDLFKVFAPLQNVDGSHVELDIGNQENIRVDHPFSIHRNIDGKEKIVGYFKVYQVGNSCLSLKKSQRTYSKGSVFIGGAEEADVGYEHPWSGIFLQYYAKHLDSTFQYNDKDTKGGAINALGFGTHIDLGYVLDDISFSEVWFNANIFLGTGSEGTMTIQDLGIIDKKASSFVLGFDLGMEKRYYLSHGLFVSGGSDIHYEIQNFDMGKNGYSDTVNLSMGTLSLEPKLKIGYNFSPDTELSGFVGYDYVMTTSTSYSIGDNDPVDIDGYDKDSGLSMGLIFNMHTDFTGIFTNMYKKPSRKCNGGI